MDADWDNLLVLDACRADVFEEVFDPESFDKYDRVRSLGGSTPEWTKRNFQGKNFGDTVYVTGNPQISKYAGDAFHELVEVWDGAFDDDRNTVFPEQMVEAAIEANERYPHKRLVIHFMQPHTPYVNRDEIFPEGHGVTDQVLDESQEELRTMIAAVGRDAVWAAYRNNLTIVRGAVQTLCSELHGRTVISSDHGELFGERGAPFYNRQYGHPSGVRHPLLVQVPWAVAEGSSRRRIRDDGTTTTESDTDEIERQLEMLGYK